MVFVKPLSLKYSNLQAALALEQLNSFEDQNKQRRANAETLLTELRPEIKRLSPIPKAESVWYFFAIGVENREAVSKALFSKGIDTGKHIMENCALLAKSTEPFPITEWWYENSIQIPIHPPLKPHDLKAVAKAINESVGMGLCPKPR